jgi:hypothetical protein
MNLAISLPELFCDISSLDAVDEFVFLGLETGEVLCFSVSNIAVPYRKIGSLQSKSHLQMQTVVRVSEDSSFCFAGARSGTSELVAIDISRLRTLDTDSVNSCSSKHRDHKLRGL